MSLPRTRNLVATTAWNCFTAGSSTRASSATSLCARCVQDLCRQRHLKPVSKRYMATAAALYPQAPDVDTPPRNDGVLHTSIAGNTQSPSQRSSAFQARQSAPSKAPPFPANTSLREGEAQKPQSTYNSPPSSSIAMPSPSPSEKTPKKSKLKARKAAMTLSSSAVIALRELLDQPEPKLIRVGVKNRGCSGLAYHLEYVEKPGSFDEAVEQDGVKVLIDSKALFSIIGSEMDWVEDKLSRRFVFKNPNITEQCGCGESFSIG